MVLGPLTAPLGVVYKNTDRRMSPTTSQRLQISRFAKQPKTHRLITKKNLWQFTANRHTFCGINITPVSAKNRYWRTFQKFFIFRAWGKIIYTFLYLFITKVGIRYTFLLPFYTFLYLFIHGEEMHKYCPWRILWVVR